MCEAQNFWSNFKKALYKNVEEKLAGQEYNSEEPRREFTFSLQLFWEAVNCYFLEQYKATAVMMRAALDAAMLHSVNSYYENRLMSIASKSKTLTHDQFKIEMAPILGKVGKFKPCGDYINYSELKKEIQKLAVLKEDDFNAIKTTRGLGNFAAHFEEKINQNITTI